MPELRLVPASPADRARVYTWMTTPGIVECMMGPPDFPDSEIPDYDEFLEDWHEAYWSDDAPEQGRVLLIEVDGEAVGMLAYNDVVTTGSGRRAVELDTWLRSPADIGHGHGPAAIAALLPMLARELGVEEVFLQPSARNPRAIRAYEKAGFRRVELRPEEAAAQFRTEADYADSVFLARRLGRLDSAGANAGHSGSPRRSPA